MRAVNLIPAQRLAERQKQRRLRAWLRGGCAYALVLLAAVLVGQAVWGQADRALAQQLGEVQRDVAARRERLDALEPKLVEATQELEATRAVAVQPDWSLLLALLAEVRGDALSLNRITLGPPGRGTRSQPLVPTVAQPVYQLELSGVGEDQQAVSQFVLRLEQAGLFQDVRLVETNRTTANDKSAVAFRVACQIGEARDEEGAES